MRVLDTSTEFGRRAERRLREERIIWLVTMRRDGMPQPLPVWFLWEEDTVLIFTQPGTQKIANLERNAMVALHLDSDGRGGDIIVLEGEAQLLTGQFKATDVAAYIEKYQEGFRRVGTTPEGFAQSYSVPIRFHVERIRGH